MRASADFVADRCLKSTFIVNSRSKETIRLSRSFIAITGSRFVEIKR